MICLWTDKLPQEHRDAGDEQLLAAFAGGLGLADLAGLFAEMFVRARGDLPDQDPGREFADREVKLATTIGGAGVVHGDLTAECAAAVAAVLDALAAPAGKEDDRTKGQRYHDALARGDAPADRGGPAAGAGRAAGQGLGAHLPRRPAPARRRLRAAGGMDRAGPGPVGRPPRGRRPRPARPTAPGWTGTPPRPSPATPRWRPSSPATSTWTPWKTWSGSASNWTGSAGRQGDGPGRAVPAGTTAAWAAVEQAVIGKAVDLLSGPGGLACFLRRRQLGVRLGGPSLPLDIGYAETVPAGIRNAVLLRDRHCQWAGGCTQPAGACEVHHTTHKAHGGKTSVKDCVLLCPFHHQIVIHRWGWTLVVNPDGTTSAWNKNKTKVLHSHGPPARAG